MPMMMAFLMPQMPQISQLMVQEPKTVSPSPDGGTARPIRRGTAFFEARGRVDHLEFVLDRGVLALVGHHADRCAARALPGLVHEQLQLLLAVLVKRTLWKELFAGIELIFSGVGEEPSHEWILKLRRARGQECG